MLQYKRKILKNKQKKNNQQKRQGAGIGAYKLIIFKAIFFILYIGLF